MACYSETLACKLHNPFNIRYNSSNHWLGQIGVLRNFCHFESEFFGVRAGFIVLKNYIKNGFNTPKKIIERFAPSIENDVNAYLSYCCEASNLLQDTIINNSFDLFKFGVAMMYYESSYIPLPSICSYIIDTLKFWTYE